MLMLLLAYLRGAHPKNLASMEDAPNLGLGAPVAYVIPIPDVTLECHSPKRRRSGHAGSAGSGQKLLCPLQRVHNVVPRASVKLERIQYQFDRLLDRERVSGREGP